MDLMSQWDAAEELLATGVFLQVEVFLLQFDFSMEILRLVTRLSTTVPCCTSKPQKRKAVTFA